MWPNEILVCIDDCDSLQDCISYSEQSELDTGRVEMLEGRVTAL